MGTDPYIVIYVFENSFLLCYYWEHSNISQTYYPIVGEILNLLNELQTSQ